MLRASLILVNYRCEQRTLECLEHLAGLEEPQPAERIVFDNSPERRLSSAPGFAHLCDHYEASAHNLGFAKAVNRAASLATESVLLLLNPDALPDPECLAGLVTLLQDHPEIGVAGPLLLPPEGQPPVPSATISDPGLRSTLIEYTVLSRLAGARWLADHYFADPGDGRRECAVLQGACLAIQRELFEQLGGFDERFFFYWEDTDLCKRVRMAGYQVTYCPDLCCYHLGGSLVRDEARETHFWNGLFAYHRKHNGLIRTRLLRSLLMPGIAAEVATLTLLDRVRRGQDQVLSRDLATHRGRLRRQFRHPAP